MKLRKDKIRYVFLDASKFLTDEDYRIMKPDERGVYCTLIFALYTHGGYIEFNEKLYSLCNCDKKNFKKIWNKIKSKFGQKRTKIFHSKVIKELGIAAARSQILTNASLKANSIRWNGKNKCIRPESDRNPNENEKRSEAKRIEEKRSEEKRSDVIDKETEETLDSDSTKSLSSITNSVRQNGFDENSESVKKIRVHQRALKFADYLNKNIMAATRSDRTSQKNICDYLSEGCSSGVFNLEIFDRAKQLVDEAMKGQKPIALFMSLAQKELGYRKKQNIN